jgi:hypothetical protein
MVSYFMVEGASTSRLNVHVEVELHTSRRLRNTGTEATALQGHAALLQATSRRNGAIILRKHRYLSVHAGTQRQLNAHRSSSYDGAKQHIHSLLLSLA